MARPSARSASESGAAPAPTYLHHRRSQRGGVNHQITNGDAETMVTMLDAGWALAAIAAHFGIDVKEVEQAIVKQVKSERNQG